MTEESIDFTQSSRRILLNPIVPLAVLDLCCRTNERAEATLLGKVFSGHIEIVEIVPVQFSEENLKFDYQEHQKKLDSLQQIYPNLEVVGAALTDIKVLSLEIPALHSIYVNKESGFKAQGVLTSPIVLSVGTDLKGGDFRIEAYSFNPMYKFCHELMGISAFEQWTVRISFGEAKVQEISPIYTALRDQEEFLPGGSLKELVQALLANLKYIRTHVENIIVLASIIQARNNVSEGVLGVALKRLLQFSSMSKEELARLNKKSSQDMKLVVYLSSVISAQNVLAEKLNKLA